MDASGLSPRPPYGEILPFSFPGTPSVCCAFTTARAGAMRTAPAFGDDAEPARNRRRVLESLGLSRWVELRQVHGNALLADPEPTGAEVASLPEADGAATRQKGLALAVKTADCQPLLLADADGTAIAALHVGWRGNVLNFPGTGLARFCALYGLDPGRVLAVRGPSLGPEAAQFVNFAREWPPAFRPWFNEQKQTMNLWELTKFQLIQAGMRPENVHSLDLCTHSLPDLFFSHRRGHAGRQVSLVWIKEG